MAGETEITIVGNMTADPELRALPSGKSVVNFTIASTPRSYDSSSRQWQDGEPLYLHCSAWGNLATHIGSSLTKGMRVIAHGRLTQRSYQTKDGQDRVVIEVSIDDIGPGLSRAVASVTKAQDSGKGR